MCHARRARVAAGLVVGLLAGCGPRAGWVRVDHHCQPTDAPRVCLQADPDAPLTLEIGGATLVPGECAEPPADGRASLPAVVRDGRTGAEHRVRVAAGSGTIVDVEVRGTDDGVDVARRRRACAD